MLKGQIGITNLCERYPRLKTALFERGWYYDDYMKKWMRDLSEHWINPEDSN